MAERKHNDTRFRKLPKEVNPMKNVDRWRAQCYSQVQTQLYQRLKDFRKDFPYKRLAVGKYDWDYIVYGDADETVLILTGATATGESNWKDILRYGLNYRVISPSYPPVGDMDRTVEGIKAILDAERIDRVHIIGASLGSGVGHVFIRRYPERVGKLVLISFGMPDHMFFKGMRTTIRTLSFIPWRLIKRKMFTDENDFLSGLPDDEVAFTRAYYRDLHENEMSKRAENA
jgi:pimeloyl-ACP methyl ester carboxylesterase